MAGLRNRWNIAFFRVIREVLPDRSDNLVDSGISGVHAKGLEHPTGGAVREAEETEPEGQVAQAFRRLCHRVTEG